MSDVLILVGTMSGTAEMAAGEIADRLEERDISCRILRMEKATIPVLAAANRVIVCTSTYGTGDVPDNARALYEALGREKPDLSALVYGVFALGSGVYPETFCFGGRRFDALFAALGATRRGEHFQHDDRSGVAADDAAGDWAEAWVEGSLVR